MSLSQIQLLQINKQIDRILNNSSNKWKANGQLEIAFVLDMVSDNMVVQRIAKDIAGYLKKHNRTFENVRCNVVEWNRNDVCSTSVVPLSFVAIGKLSCEEEKSGTDFTECEVGVHKLERLAAYLKMYHARSKCIILISQGQYVIEDKEIFVEAMNPFLKSKLLVVTEDEFFGGAKLVADIVINNK